jgi:hypothetical protein
MEMWAGHEGVLEGHEGMWGRALGKRYGDSAQPLTAEVPCQRHLLSGSTEVQQRRQGIRPQLRHSVRDAGKRCMQGIHCHYRHTYLEVGASCSLQHSKLLAAHKQPICTQLQAG